MRRFVIGATVSWVALAAATAVPAQEHSPARQLCGTERWTVKTLQDRPRLLRPRTVTVAYLTHLPARKTLSHARLPFERHVVRTEAAVTLVRAEANGDLHLVLPVGPALPPLATSDGICI